MAEAHWRTEILLARVTAAVIITLIALGAVWYGFSAEVQQRIWRDIVERPGGPMGFRYFLQPVMAALFAARIARRWNGRPSGAAH